MRLVKFFVAGLLVAALLVVGGTAMASSGVEFCAGTEPFVFGPDGEPVPDSVSCEGSFRVVDPWSDTVTKGETRDYENWAGARDYAREWKGGSIWRTGPPAAPTAKVKPGEAMVTAEQVQASAVNRDRTNPEFCSGNREFVFDHQALSEPDAPCGVSADQSKEFYLRAPWRDGGPYNPTYGVWDSWRNHVRFLKASGFTNGSFWRKPQVAAAAAAAAAPPAAEAPASASAKAEARVIQPAAEAPAAAPAVQAQAAGIPWWTWVLIAVITVLVVGGLAGFVIWLWRRAAAGP